MTGGSAGRRPIIGGLLIITLLRRIILLLRRLISPLRLRLIRGLRPPVNFSGYATPGSPEQSADTRPLQGVVVINGGPDAGPQEPTQPRTSVQVGVLTRCGASRQQTQAQQTYQYPLIFSGAGPKSVVLNS